MFKFWQKTRLSRKHYETTFIVVILLFVFATLISSYNLNQATAAFPKFVNFQGKLTKVSDGTNVANGPYAFEFNIYNVSSGGTSLWTESWDGSPAECPLLTVTNGVFNAKLGSCNPLTIDVTGGNLYLSVNFNPGGGLDGEMSPRKQLVASAFAFNANNVVGDGRIDIAYAPGTATNPGAKIDYSPSVASSNNALQVISGSNVTGAAIELSGAGASSRVINSTSSALTLQTTTSGNITMSPAAGSGVVMTQAISTSGTPAPIITVTGAAHTALANAEATDFSVNLARTVQFTGTSTLATQRAVKITAPTYSSDTATKTITDAVTFAISGAPVKSTNLAITNTYAVKIEGGAVSTATNAYGLFVDAPTGATNNYAAVFNTGNVGIGDLSPSAKLEVGDGTDSLRVSSVGDLLFVDADSGSSITGPTGGALTIAGSITDGGGPVTNVIINSASLTDPNSKLLVLQDNGAERAYFGAGGTLHMLGSAIYLNSLADNRIDTSTNTMRYVSAGGVAATFDSSLAYFSGVVGVATTAPDSGLEINHASGNNLRLTYNDGNGSATNYVDFLTTSGGGLSVKPSGFIANIGGGTSVTELRFLEPSGTGSDYAGFKSNANVTTSYVWTFPAADASGCIQSNGSGTLSISACSGSASLQASYNGGNTIATSGSPIAFTLNSADKFTVATAASGTGASEFTLSDGSNPTPPAQLILIRNNDTGEALASALKVTSAGGAITTAIDLTDTNIGDALSIGTNSILGTTANIDLTNFDVVGSSGAVTAGGLITGTGGLTLTGTTNINTTGSSVTTIGAASGTDLALLDANWSITGAGAANFASIGTVTPGSGAFTTLTSSGATTLGTGASLTNTFGSGASSINTIGAVTTPGALTLHGATTLDNTLTVSGSNLTSLGGNLTVTGTAWTATPTISGLITATSGLTSNGTLTVGTQTISGTTGIIDYTDFDVDSDGKVTLGPDSAGDAINITYDVAADIQGIVIDASTGTNNTTQTGGIIQITADTATDTAVLGLALTGNVRDAAGALSVYGNKTTLTVDLDAGSDHSVYGQHITITNNDPGSSAYGLFVDVSGALDRGIVIESSDTSTNELFQIKDQSSNNIFSVKRDVTTFGTSIVGNGTGVVFPTGYVYGQFGDSGGNGRFDLNTTIGLGLEANGQVVWNSSFAGTTGDAGVGRGAAGVVRVTNGSTGAGKLTVGDNGAGTTSRLTLASALSAAAWGTNGIQLQAAAATYTDTTSTLGGSPVATAVFNSFGQPTINASDAGGAVTYTDAATVYIANAPIADGGGNDVITNAYSLWVDNGNVRFDGNLTVTGTCTGCGGGGTLWNTIGDAGGNGDIAMGTTTQTMDWTTLSTGVGLTLTSTTGLTTGSVLKVTNAATTSIDNGVVVLSASGAYTGTGGLLNATATASTAGTLINFTNNTASFTGTGITASFTGTTTGNDLVISPGAGVTSGSALQITASGTSAITNGLLQVTHSGAFTGAGGLMKLTADSTTAGTVASISANQIQGGTVLGISSTAATGVTGSLLSVTSATTTGAGNIIAVSTTGLNGTGSAMKITGPSGATAVTNGLVQIAAAGAYTGTGGLLNVTSAASTAGTLVNFTNNTASFTGNLQSITADGITSGKALSITAGGATSMTSGQGLLVTGPTGAAAISADSGLVKITVAGALTTTTGAGSGGLLNVQGNAVITGTLASISDTAVMTTTGNLLSLVANAATTTTGLLTQSATGLTTGYVQSTTLGTALTTGGAFNMTGASYNHANSQTGNLINIAFTEGTTTAGAVTSTTNGFLITPTINTTTSTSGVKTINAIKVGAPTLTNCTGGATCTYTGLNIDTTGTLASATIYSALFNGGNVGIGIAAPTANLHNSFASTSTTAESVAFISGEGSQTITGNFTDARYNKFLQTTLTATSSRAVTNSSTLNIQGATIAAGSGPGGVTITNSSALQIDAGAVNGSQGTVTNSYGLYLSAQTGAANNYAATFATGNVGIGDTSPLSLFTVGAGDLFQVGTDGDITLATAAATTAITITDADYTNALSVGNNNITGAGYTITSTASGLTVNSTSADLTLQTTTSGDILIKPASFITNIGGGTTATDLRFYEPSGATGNEYVGFKAPADVTTSVVWSLPVADATGCLKANSDTTITISSCGGGSQTPWTSDIDGDNFKLLDLGTNITARAGLTVTATSADLALVTATSGNITIAPASTGSVQLTSGVTSGTGTSSGLSLVANSVNTGVGLNVSATAITSGSGLRVIGGSSLTTGGDLIDLDMSTAAAGNGINIVNTGTYTGTGLAVLTANSASTGTLMKISGTGLTSGIGLVIVGGSGMTTGSDIDINGATYVHPTGETGSLAKISFTESTITGSITTITNGLLVSPTINAGSGAATRTINGLSVTPAFTSCGAGTCEVNGLNIGDVTDGTNFTGQAIKIGAGWDTGIRFNETTIGNGTNYVGFKAPASITTDTVWTLPSADASGCLKSNGSLTLSIGSCGDTKVEVFDSNSTYTVPADAQMIVMEAIGGGGSGGGGAFGNIAQVAGGGGGGGGAYSMGTFTAAEVGGANTVLQVQRGAGGAAVTATTDGNSGGTSCVSSSASCSGTIYHRAFGGGGGSASTNNGANLGGGGGGGGGSGSAGNNAAATNRVGGTGGGAVAVGVTGGIEGGGGATGLGSGAQGGEGGWGGGGGGGSSTNGAATINRGGNSARGGGGGGGGASCAISPCATARVGQSGGNGGSNRFAGGAGGTAPGGTGTAGTNSTANSAYGGGGGGGGGSNQAASGVPGGGGAGGAPGGGGGGGGTNINNTAGTTGAAGGAGGNGRVRITTLRGAGADLAEMYATKDKTIKPGDVVAIDPTLNAGVRKSQKTYDSTTIGVVSTDPGLVIGNIDQDPTETPVVVALTGRVPVKVSLENGPINIGDQLTPSSIPGVAMKATKAGLIIGQALSKFDQSIIDLGDADVPTGYVMMFIKNSHANGATLAQVIPGLSLGLDPPSTDPPEPGVDPPGIMPKVSSDATIGKMALSYFVATKQELGQTVDFSEILTDRLSAALEVISPKILTDELSTRAITSSADNGNVTFELSPTGKLIITGISSSNSGTASTDGPATTTAVITFDSTGNAIFAGNLKAKTISAESISGFEILTNKISELTGSIDGLTAPQSWATEESLNALQLLVDNFSEQVTLIDTRLAEVEELSQTFASLEGLAVVTDSLDVLQGLIDQQQLSLDDQANRLTSIENTTILDLTDLNVSGSLSVSGTIAATGGLSLNNVNAVGDLINILNDIEFIGRPYFNNDTAGFALIKKGQKQVDIVFDKPYLEQPIVNATVTMDSDLKLKTETDPEVIRSLQDAQDALIQSLFDANISFLVTKKSENGFTIILNKPAPTDINFSWLAVAVKSAKVFSSKVDATNVDLGQPSGPEVIPTDGSPPDPAITDPGATDSGTGGGIAPSDPLSSPEQNPPPAPDPAITE